MIAGALDPSPGIVFRFSGPMMAGQTRMMGTGDTVKVGRAGAGDTSAVVAPWRQYGPNYA